MNFHRKLDEFGVEMRGNLYWKLDAFVLENLEYSGRGIYLLRFFLKT